MKDACDKSEDYDYFVIDEADDAIFNEGCYVDEEKKKIFGFW